MPPEDDQTSPLVCEVRVRLGAYQNTSAQELDDGWTLVVLGYDFGQLVVTNQVGTDLEPAPFGEGFYSTRPIMQLDVWSVTHKSSGYCVIKNLLTKKHALAAAQGLSAYDFDAEVPEEGVLAEAFKPSKELTNAVHFAQELHCWKQDEKEVKP